MPRQSADGLAMTEKLIGDKSMNTPICDFVNSYIQRDALRLHMPGHKGAPLLGMEQWDITEIAGADSLYEAEGIIAQSEQNARELFGCTTLYSAEGSSQCIKAMLHLALVNGKARGKKPLIAAGRNAHKAFLSGAALLGIDVMWLYPSNGDSYLSCNITGEELDEILQRTEEKPFALYLTSPDYLGNTADIAGIAEVCRRYDMLLLVDNAHGAYLKFLTESRFPIDLGADMCCSSAHKTLPVLTGGAYLHISDTFPQNISLQAKNSLSLFGSTSPSYLILQSLDRANLYLEGYGEKLSAFLPNVYALKQRLIDYGWQLYGDEPLKITIKTKPMGYLGSQLAELLLNENMVCEFFDPDFLVLMLTPETGEAGLAGLESALLSIPRKPPVEELPPAFARGERVMSIREAALAPVEMIPIAQSEGRVLGAASVGCPPAVPILVCGERIDRHAMACFAYYGIENCGVVKE